MFKDFLGDTNKIQKLAETEEVKVWSSQLQLLMKSSPCPDELIDKFHAVVIQDESWVHLPITIQRIMAHGMAMGYLLASPNSN